MSATADHAEGQRSRAEKLGFSSGQVVQEIGFDDDCDEELRASIEEVTGVKVLSLHHDISTATGEEVIVFTLVESPHFRDVKR